MTALAGLFVSALVAATLLPAQSEAVLSLLALQGAHPLWLLWSVATVGNTLGSLINYGLGRGLERFSARPWFPVGPAALARARVHYQRWGHWSLLGSWLPLVGDPLTLVAGVLREPLWRFVAVVAFAKGARYAVLLWLVLQVAP
ncbi:MAG: hypothetical protein RL026_95 [Pseudomonadota bacterium]|jgi:membrane protein YqaA with SNARE-associated domain